MTLKIVNNNGQNETHSVRVDDGKIEVILIETGDNISLSDMEETFPDFKEIIDTSKTTYELLDRLVQTNPNYIWAHVSGKI